MEPADYMIVQPDDLRDDHVRVFTVLSEALHHRTKQGLRDPGCAIQGLFDCELSGTLRAFDLRPDLFEQHPRTSIGPLTPDCLGKDPTRGTLGSTIGSANSADSLCESSNGCSLDGRPAWYPPGMPQFGGSAFVPLGQHGEHRSKGRSGCFDMMGRAGPQRPGPVI
jgi:hypothetical protein